jgi:hypothetical protein
MATVQIRAMAQRPHDLDARAMQSARLRKLRCLAGNDTTAALLL